MRADSPYNAAHQRERRKKLPGARCPCGAPATELDHTPPLSRHHHVNGSGCCSTKPSCGPCARRQGGRLSRFHTYVEPVPMIVVDVEADVTGRGPEDPCWDVEWLERLLDVPPEATWPRFMTTVHPEAVGSYGAECVAWLMSEGGFKSLRWWQDLVLVRALEHDRDGDLCWLEVLPTTSRQSGKSTALRAAAMWRLHQADRFGEEQCILHTSKDLAISKEVRRQAQGWAEARGYETREANGQESISAPDGSRWLVRGKHSIYGYSTSLGIIDEAWGLEESIADDAMLPTMMERISPQVIIASTAHRKATPLFSTRRAQALQELDSPDSTLLLEWSAPRTASIEDRDAWRQASPHWSKGRERLLEARLRKVQSGQSIDPTEDDPTESFQCQYLNSWLPAVTTDAGEALLDIGVWMKAKGSAPADARIFAAIEDYFGKGCAVAVVARDGDRFEIDAWTSPSWDQAVADVATVFTGRDHGKLLLGPSMWDRIGGSQVSARCVTSTDTRSGLALLRQLSKADKVVHDYTPELDQQMAAVRVRELASGMNLIPGQRADLIKASVWALQAAHRQRVPAVH